MIFNTKTTAVTLAFASSALSQTLRQGQEIVVNPVPVIDPSNSTAPIEAVQPPPELIVDPPPAPIVDDAEDITLDTTAAVDLVSSTVAQEVPTIIVEATSSVDLVSSALDVIDAVETSSVIVSESSLLAEAETSSIIEAVETSSAIVSESSVLAEAETSSLLFNETSAIVEAVETSSAIVSESSVLAEAETSSLIFNETSAIVEAVETSSAIVSESSAFVEAETSSLALNATSSAIETSPGVTADRNLIFPNATLIQVETFTQVLDNNITVTNVVTSEQTITAPPEAAATETETLVSTQIITQPSVIIVQQITFFVFQSALGAICPAVQPAPAVPAVPGQPAPQPGQGGFIVGGQTFPQFQQACMAACNIQLNQCQSIIGNGIQLTQCQSQFIACQGAAATATVTVEVPTTITQTVVLPPEAVQTDAPAITSHIVEGGGQVITTTVLASDAVATVGPGGVSIVTVTATPAPVAVPAPSQPPVENPPAQNPPAPAPPAEQPVTSIITVTMENPAQPGVPQISTATITMQNPPQQTEAQVQPQTSVVTITMGDQVGIVTMTVPAAGPTGAAECEVCQPPVTVTETRVLTETVSFCEPQAATVITETLIPSETPVIEAPPPPEMLEEPPHVGKGKGKEGKHHRFESYFDNRRKRSLRAFRRP